MVESLRELNSICQKPRYREVGNWMARHITRPMALPLTWILLHTPISANGVTLAGMTVVFLAALCFACPEPLVFFVGALLFQLWYLLDHVDGQIARYRKQSSLTGLYFDFLSHYFTNSVIFFGLGWHVFGDLGRVEILPVAFIGSFAYALFQGVFDCKYRAYYVGLSGLLGKRIVVRGRGGERGAFSQSRSTARKLFSFLHKLCEIHVFMNLLTLCAVVNLWVSGGEFDRGSFSLPNAFFFWYTFLLPTVTGTLIVHSVKSRSVDRDFEQEFTAEEG